jgi:transposase
MATAAEKQANSSCPAKQQDKAREKLVLSEAKKLPCYQRLQGGPGVGRILALTVTLETGDIKRFPSAGDYASYCRTVDSQRLSNAGREVRHGWPAATK